MNVLEPLAVSDLSRIASGKDTRRVRCRSADVEPDTERLLDAVGRRVGELRERAGLTQAAAAERLGTCLSNWQRVEYGGQNLALVTMAKIAHVTGVEIGSLLEPPRTKRAGRGRLPKGVIARPRLIFEQECSDRARSR